MSKYDIIGYVGTRDLGTLTEEDIQTLDVINIAFANVKNDEVFWQDFGSDQYIERARAINPDIKFIISVGGWGAGGFSEAAATPEGREKFAKTCVQIVQEHRLDGVDIDWEYPGYGVAGIGSSPDDEENFTLLIQRVRNELDQLEDKHYMLTIAVGAGSYYTDCTQMDKVQEYLDYVQLMTYDMRGGFQVLTGHHANVYTPRGDLFKESVDNTVKGFYRAGVPYEKMVVGVAFYSRMWTNVPNVNNGYLQMAKSTGGYGPGYSQLVEEYIDKNGYVRYWDNEAKAPYLFNGETFISYDDPESIVSKVDYMKKYGLRGIMYWEYKCDETHTLTGVIDQAIRG